MPANKERETGPWSEVGFLWENLVSGDRPEARSLVSLLGKKRPARDFELGNASRNSARWKTWWSGCLQGLEQTAGQQLKRLHACRYALARRSWKSSVSGTRCPGSPSGQSWGEWLREGCSASHIPAKPAFHRESTRCRILFCSTEKVSDRNSCCYLFSCSSM